MLQRHVVLLVDVHGLDIACRRDYRYIWLCIHPILKTKSNYKFQYRIYLYSRVDSEQMECFNKFPLYCSFGCFPFRFRGREFGSDCASSWPLLSFYLSEMIAFNTMILDLSSIIKSYQIMSSTNRLYSKVHHDNRSVYCIPPFI